MTLSDQYRKQLAASSVFDRVYDQLSAAVTLSQTLSPRGTKIYRYLLKRKAGQRLGRRA